MSDTQTQGLPILDIQSRDELLAAANGTVSYISDTNYFGTKTTATIISGQCTRLQFASDYLREALCVPPAPRQIIVATGKRSEPYAGPFPRGKHSHRCMTCGGNAVACYKAKCTKPQTTSACQWCR